MNNNIEVIKKYKELFGKEKDFFEILIECHEKMEQFAGILVFVRAICRSGEGKIAQGGIHHLDERIWLDMR